MPTAAAVRAGFKLSRQNLEYGRWLRLKYGRMGRLTVWSIERELHEHDLRDEMKCSMSS